MSKPLFSDFPKASSKQWKQLIQFDLNGDDYNEALIWKTNEGIDVKPFYHADVLESIQNVSDTKATKWAICQTIFVANLSKSNTKAVDAIERGAERIKFILPTEEISINDLLININLDEIAIYFELQFLNSEFVKELSSIPSAAGIYIQTDIIGNLARTGNWFTNLKEDHSQFENIVKATHSFSVDVSLYQNAGATMVQQLAYAMAHANEYLNHFSANERQDLKVIFNVSVGTNYFFEIAKLKALRVLWETLANAYQVATDCHIFAIPTKRNKTIYDYNTNMLRTTTECMSAILGGTNTICNLAYDTIYHKDNEFGERISRNQLLILKNESYFNSVNNPSDGAYYIETLTQQLAEKALNLFKDLEAHGGFLHQLKEGIIQKKIKESAAKEQAQFDLGALILLGTNKHTNKNDLMKHELELYPFVKTNPVKTLIVPIIEKRLAEAMEQKRIAQE